MRKTKTEILPLTWEELKENRWKNYLLLEKFNSFGTPTYSHKIGDSIRVGNLKDCIVEEIKEHNGCMIYGFSYLASENKKEFMYTPWYSTRPISALRGNTSFTDKDAVQIDFHNTTLDSLLNKFYLSGVEMNPPYQRDYVWDEKDKESLLDSIFHHIEIGKFAFIERSYSADKLYEILDGKQRLSTLLDFYENRWPYKGFYFNDLSPEDRYTFLNTTVGVGQTEELSLVQIYKYFYTLNKSGKTMDEGHLQKIKERIEELQEIENEYEKD